MSSHALDVQPPLSPEAQGKPGEDNYKRFDLRFAAHAIRRAVEELDRLGVEKYENGDGDEWSILKRIQLLAAEVEDGKQT